MKRTVTHRPSKEPRDRRQLRLIHALLAFPVAGVIGFTGNAIVMSVVSDSPVVTAPAPPERTTDEHTSPREGGNAPETESTTAESVA